MSDLGVYGINKLLTDSLRSQGFNRVTFGNVSEKDLQDQSIFPLAHLSLLTNRQTSSVNYFNYEIHILDLVDVNANDPRESENQLSLTSNVEDVFHDLSFKFNRAWQSVQKNVNEIVELPTEITLTAGYSEAQNRLAGYQISIEIAIPNLGIC